MGRVIVEIKCMVAIKKNNTPEVVFANVNCLFQRRLITEAPLPGCPHGG